MTKKNILVFFIFLTSKYKIDKLFQMPCSDYAYDYLRMGYGIQEK